MSIAEALRQTSKGQLKHTKYLDALKLKDDLSQLSPPPLSRHHEEKESSKINVSFGLDISSFESIPSPKTDFNENSCARRISSISDQQRKNSFIHRLDAVSDEEEKADESKDIILDLSELIASTSNRKAAPKTPLSHSISCPVSPEFASTLCTIHDINKKRESVAQLSLAEKKAEFENHDRDLSFHMTHKLKELKNKFEEQAEHKQNLIDKTLQKSLEETNKKLQRLKQDHDDHHKKISTKQKELERQKELLEQEERRKAQQELAEKLETLEALYKEIDSACQTFISLHDSFEHKAKLPEHVDKYRAVIDRTPAGFASQVQAAKQASSIPDQLIVKFRENKNKSLHAVEFLKKQIEETQTRVKAEEAKEKEDEKRKAEEQQEKVLVKQLEGNLTVQTLAFVHKEIGERSKKLADVESKIQSFVSNTQLKKYRFDLQRAVNTPINAISGISGAHLWDKLRRLQNLLTGQMVEVTGKFVSVNDAPEGILFCQNLIAKMLVKKGEEQVTSKHESAFAISAMVVALWVEFPVIGDLFMSHLQVLCPYVLPHYASQQEGQSKEDYYRSLGYKTAEDGTLEEQDKFLRRMSGLMRLYCACMVTTLPPRESNAHHPHGLENAWMWLARAMNLDPHPDITATLIHDVLSVTGNAMFKEYGIQFAKLLYLLYKVYLPKLQSVSVTSATLGRLHLFLEKAMQTAKIPPPDGLLAPDFWSTS